MDCGDIGGNKDWKMVVVSDSRCLGTAGSEPSDDTGDAKLFMTSRGGERYSFLLAFGCLMAFCMSLLSEYLSILKCNVGPRGVRAKRMFVFPVVDREKSSK